MAVATFSVDSAGDVANARRLLRSFWDAIRESHNVSVVVLLFDGPASGAAPPRPLDDPDGDPRVGPKSCSVDQPVIVAAAGTIDAWSFPMLVEADAVVCAFGGVLRDARDTLGAPEGELPLSTLLPLSRQEVNRLALLGTMTVERAHELGVVTALCEPSALVETAFAMARRSPY